MSKNNDDMKVIGCRIHKDDIAFLDKEVERRNNLLNPYEQKTRSDLVQYAILQYIEHIKKLTKEHKKNNISSRKTKALN